jgi:hypothetical protein
MPPITSLAPSPRGAWHYETGLVIVIGKTAKNISEADAFLRRWLLHSQRLQCAGSAA